MSNLPDIEAVYSKHGIEFIVVVTPDFKQGGAWWQLVSAMNGRLISYGFANGWLGCMLRAMKAGKRAGQYRIKKRDKNMDKFLSGPISGGMHTGG